MLTAIRIFSLQSVEYHLHSDSRTLLSALLLDGSRSLAGENATDEDDKEESKVQTGMRSTQELIGKLLLTNLVHHTKASHLSAIVDFVLELVAGSSERLEGAQGEAESDVAEEDFVVNLSWLCICVGVRKGSRIEGEFRNLHSLPETLPANQLVCFP